MATLDNLVNTQLGQYQILEKLGQGGMATVFKAHEQSLNRVVALKVLHPSLAENEEYIKRFKREAQSAAKLNHPNIVHIYSIGEDKGHHFFAMELIKGDSLADYKRSGQKLNTERILAITRQIAAGLAAAHEAGLVHRDIKPSNIMLLSDGSVKVADFGIAQVTGGETKLTMDGAVIGTPEYLSPEQCEGRPIDGRSDIYSLGVTLYELLSGKTPYHADTPVSMLMKIVKGEYPPLGSIVPDIPSDIENLVKRMMATKVEQRFQNCGELISAIDTIKNNVKTIPSAEVLLTTLNPETKTQKRKSKSWMALVAVLVLAMGVGAAMYYKLIPIPWEKQSDPAQTTEVAANTNQISAQETLAVNEPQNTDTKADNDIKPSDDTATDAGTKAQIQMEQSASEAPQAHFEPPTDNSQTTQTKPVETTEFQSPAQTQSKPALTANTKPNSDTAQQDPARHSEYLHLLIKEENDQSELILTSVEEKLMKHGVQVIRGEPDGNIPYTALIVSFRTVGATNLQYYGHTSQQTQAFLTLSLIELPSRRPISAPQKREVLFTELNLSENIDEAVEAALAGFDWQEIRQKRRLLTRGKLLRKVIQARREGLVRN